MLFSLEAAYDERVGSAIADTLMVGGKRLRAAAPDPLTVVVTFPEPFAPGLRILDNLPVFPKHLLGAALKSGTFGSAWGVGTPPDQIAGLGPFVVSEYAPGQRVVFARNPRYWRRAANGDALPYLDRVTIEIIPDQDSEVLRLDAGQPRHDGDRAARARTTRALKRAADAGRLKMLDLGVGFDADSLWFNLKPGGLGPDDTPRRAGCRAISCGARSRWRSIASCSPTRSSSAPACRSTARSPRPTGSGTPICRRCRTTRRAPGRSWRRSASPIATATACSRTRPTGRPASR